MELSYSFKSVPWLPCWWRQKVALKVTPSYIFLFFPFSFNFFPFFSSFFFFPFLSFFSLSFSFFSFFPPSLPSSAGSSAGGHCGGHHQTAQPSASPLTVPSSSSRAAGGGWLWRRHWRTEVKTPIALSSTSPSPETSSSPA